MIYAYKMIVLTLLLPLHYFSWAIGVLYNVMRLGFISSKKTLDWLFND